MNMPTATKVLVIGLGKTGLSCARYLSHRGFSVAVNDSREQPPGLEVMREEMPGVALFLGRFSEEAFAEADLLVVSPGVPVSEPMIQQAMERGVPVVGDIELFAQEAKAPVVAITGSNGKSTVTTLLGEMAAQAGLQVRVGGNLGEPALDLLDPEAELYVLELSSFQLETTWSLRPAVAVVLNVSADHMDRYPGIDAYAGTKAGIYQDAERRVFNLDDPLVMAMRGEAGDDLLFTLGEPDSDHCFGLRRENEEEWLCRGQHKLLAAPELRMPGRHNLANALAALAMGSALGLEEGAMLEVLRRFTGLPHRTQYVAEHGGVRWYNDSKGTNVGAVIAALEGLADGRGRTVLIAGGECKDGDFSQLAPVVAEQARAVVLVGRDAPELERSLSGCAPLFRAADMSEAVAIAGDQAQPGDRVLLSPGCASFDMFDNYEHRGRVFTEAVERWVQ